SLAFCAASPNPCTAGIESARKKRYTAVTAAKSVEIAAMAIPIGPVSAAIARPKTAAAPPAAPNHVDNLPSAVTIVPNEETKDPVSINNGPAAAIKAAKAIAVV